MPTVNHTNYDPSVLDDVESKRKASGTDTLSDDELKELALKQYANGVTPGATTSAKPVTQQQQRSIKFPTEIVDLPSRGLVYSDGNPLRSGQIEMKYMTAREEDILASPNLARQGIILDKLFESLIVSPIKYEDLFIGDRNGIMVAARLLAYGKAYESEVTDPTLPGDVKQRVIIDLTSIGPKEIDWTIFEEEPTFTPTGEREYFYTLPTSQNTIGFKLLTVKDESLIKSEIKSLAGQTKKTGIDKEFTTRMKHIITSVNGVHDKKEIIDFVDNYFLASDSRAFRTYYKQITPDVDLTFTFVSDATGETVELEVPIDANFFWPK